jgi:hypothetical protein
MISAATSKKLKTRWRFVKFNELLLYKAILGLPVGRSIASNSCFNGVHVLTRNSNPNIPLYVHYIYHPNAHSVG